ncbi:MAG TPA: helix-turn-helix domain-containing protein [Aeromicrobium sp.]|nr:helix-turn-helix domain-containing protein [Aeromicrobium sp.]
MSTRRRGEALESDILAAAWDVLQELPWDEFRVQVVADRAETSKSVLYRRWPDRLALALAAVNERSTVELSLDRWTGDLREDLLLMLEGAAGMLGGAFGSVFRAVVAESAGVYSELVTAANSNAAAELVKHLLQLAGKDPAEVSDSALLVGPALLFFNYLTTNETPLEAVRIQIVDTCWMPALNKK